ncbi:L-2-hydroxyglutarate oxidase [Photobacterium angustum]|uniref:L-2-hydroxyglutarate oxidase n=1 Tax=Photobacterium angustum TaxID=661 RepID=UPI0005DD129E|nr:L-2-hydroxyglutarate oxidase [Photobacterium angustum]KJG17514.1 hydroxyglutarate oxidase [Photobacterium angustum]KJG23988.1 hydroxyglutarate oxidase [Photobacterium angustum]KJG31326.1 hydroxyglutarate oxidase [Photobacterium angustum]PSW97065.1 L-2-hydroxyglutarate oxidase [Photobacterium angustum]PSW99851.1 L-2-hydroxyglutarate oxidase [Photobacterium angustum]
MLDCDFLVIGAGIIGLSTAWELQQRFPQKKIWVIEKEAHEAFHQTGHNSGVIHAGIYYTPGSLKSDFCLRGNQAIKAFCNEFDIPFEQCGKLVVATNPTEQQRLQQLVLRAAHLDINIPLLDQDALKQKEPNITGISAIFVPDSAIVNYHLICQKLVELIRQHNGHVIFNQTVEAIEEKTDSIAIKCKTKTFLAGKLIACAGLQSDRIVSMLGTQPSFSIIPFRGDYYQLPNKHNDQINHLIYPVPDPSLPFLGIHLTKMIDGSITVGPNAVLNFAREAYDSPMFNLKDSLDLLSFKGLYPLLYKHLSSALTEFTQAVWKPSYLAKVQTYYPQLTLSDLQPYPCGIRAQAVSKKGQLIDDFMFHQTALSLVVCNAPSPAATSCFPIAQYIVDKLRYE